MLFLGLLLLIGNCPPLWSQSEELEALQAQLDTASSDLSRSNIYVLLSKKSIPDYHQAIQFGQQALQLGLKSSHKKPVAEAYFSMGYIHYLHNYYTEAISAFKKADPIYSAIHDTLGLIYISYYAGYAYNDMGYFEKAIESFEQTLFLSKASSNEQFMNVALNALGPAYCLNFEYQKGLDATHKALVLAQNHGLNLSSTYNQMALVYESVGKYRESTKYMKLSWAHQEEMPAKPNVANRLLNLGKNYLLTGQYDSSMYYYLAFLEAAIELNDTETEGTAWYNLAQLQLALDDLVKAEEYVKEALELFNTKLDSIIALQLLAQIQTTQKEYTKAYNTVNVARRLFYFAKQQSIQTYSLEIGIYNQLGIIRLKENKVDSALFYHEKALALANKWNNKSSLPNTYYYLAEVALSSNKFDQAYQYATQSLQLAQVANFKQNLDRVYAVLARCAAQKGAYKQAYQYQIRFQEVKDSLLGVEKNKQVMKLQIEYAVKEKEVENKLLKAEQTKHTSVLRQRTMLAIGLVLILLFVSIIALILKSNNQLQNERNQLLEAEAEKRMQELLETNLELTEIRQVKLLEEAKLRFFANISHEFRTPLTLILGSIDSMLKSDSLTNENTIRLLRTQRNSKQLLGLVSEILDVTKLESKQLVLEEEPTLLHPLVCEIVGDFSTYALGKNIKLALVYQPKFTLEIELDQDKFVKILNNFISNALKFTPKAGQIEVRIEDRNDQLCLAVTDTGLGIPKNELEAVFERYYQVKPDPENNSFNKSSYYRVGTGIGLSLCKDYADLFQGKIWAESPANKGNGTTFYFEFPKKEAASPFNDPPSIDHQPATFPRKEIEASIFNHRIENRNEALLTILVVEDNYDLCAYLREILEKEYHIITAENGWEALKTLGKMNHTPSLILSDVMMPEMDGFQLLEKLKSSDLYRHIPVMMLTARSGIQDRTRALRIGVDDYMLKPFNGEELKVRVNKLVLNMNSRMESIEMKQSSSDTEVIPLSNLQQSQADTEWLMKLEEEVAQIIPDFSYTADDLAKNLFMSRATFFRKIKRLTGLTVNQYIKEIRLQTARRLLENSRVQSVKELSYSVGFKHINYFSKSFADRFGQRPSKYL